MNKELREDLEHLIICKDKSITPDLRDDISLTLQYIDELENKIDKAIEELKLWQPEIEALKMEKNYLLDILRGEDNE